MEIHRKLALAAFAGALFATGPAHAESADWYRGGWRTEAGEPHVFGGAHRTVGAPADAAGGMFPAVGPGALGDHGGVGRNRESCKRRRRIANRDAGPRKAAPAAGALGRRDLRWAAVGS